MLARRLCLRACSPSCLATTPSLSWLKNRPVGAVTWPAERVFVTTPRHRKSDVARIQGAHQEAAQNKEETQESVKPESVKKETTAQPATKNDPLLSEQTVSNKEQRKADWAIIKDMAHYIWPKDDFGTRFRVGLSVGLLIGAKVRTILLVLSRSIYVDSTSRFSTSKSPSTSNPSSTA